MGWIDPRRRRESAWGRRTTHKAFRMCAIRGGENDGPCGFGQSMMHVVRGV